MLRILVAASLLLLALPANAEPWSMSPMWGWKNAPDEVLAKLSISGDQLKWLGGDVKVHGWMSSGNDALFLLWSITAPPSDLGSGEFARFFLDGARMGFRDNATELSYEEVPSERSLRVTQVMSFKGTPGRMRTFLGFDASDTMVGVMALCVGKEGPCGILDTLTFDDQHFVPLPALPKPIKRLPYLLGHLLVFAILSSWLLRRRETPKPWPAWLVGLLVTFLSGGTFAVWFIPLVTGSSGGFDAGYELGKTTGLYHLGLGVLLFFVQRGRVLRAKEPVTSAAPPARGALTRPPPIAAAPPVEPIAQPRVRTPSRAPSSIPLDLDMPASNDIELGAMIASPSAPSSDSAPIALRGKLSYATASISLTTAAIDAVQEDGTRHAVEWSVICGVVARRLPTVAPYDGITFVDIVSTSGATLRILPWTEIIGKSLPGSPDERARVVVQLVVARCPEAQLDSATRTFLGSRGPAVQLPDVATLAEHDRRLA